MYRYSGPSPAGEERESVLELVEALQRSMLPQTAPDLYRVQTGFRYLPGNDLIQVGGDWLDVMALPRRRVGLVVGDVMGHGVASAAVMGQLRTAVQTLAHLGLPPGEVLRHLDEAARRLSETHLATCLYGVYDPVTRVLSMANAGHPPPALSAPGRAARTLDVPTGVPIGIGGHAFGTFETPIEDDEVLAFYTDGLVENPKRDIGDGIGQLLTALTAPARSLDELCDRVVEGLNTSARTDDATLLLARLHGLGPGCVATWTLEPGPRAAGQVRILLAGLLERWGLSALVPAARLAATELVSNAIGFASRPITVRALRTDVVTIEVHDDAHLLPELRGADPLSESGRGLRVVDQLAHRWGANRTEAGKVVWCELQPPASDGADTDD